MGGLAGAGPPAGIREPEKEETRSDFQVEFLYRRGGNMDKIATDSLRSSLLAALLLFLLGTSAAEASVKHIIQFGGTLGLVYSPNSLSVSVGDTIEWQGDFSTHPLSSTTIPATAASWHNGSGTVFDYVVMVPGTYNYQCDVHFSFGMVGSFVATATGVEGEESAGEPSSFRLYQNSPNPFNPSTSIRFDIPQTSQVRLVVYNVLGQQVATLANDVRPAGRYTVLFDAGKLASGVYLYRLTAGDFVATRRLMLLR
jgi:plastocyanin